MCPQCHQVRSSQQNSRAPQLFRSTFTIELLGTDGLPFLDTLIKPTANSIESTVYRKPTHTDRYLDYNSNHPISAKSSVIHTLNLIAKHVYFTPEFLAEEIDHLHKAPQDNHYPAQFLQQDNPQQKAKPIHRKVHRRNQSCCTIYQRTP